MQTAKTSLKWKKTCGVTSKLKNSTDKHQNLILSIVKRLSKLNWVPTNNKFKNLTKGCKLPASTVASNVLQKLNEMATDKKDNPLRVHIQGFKNMPYQWDTSGIRSDIHRALEKEYNQCNIGMAKMADGSIELEREGVQNELLQQAKDLFGEIDSTPLLTGVWAHYMIPAQFQTEITKTKKFQSYQTSNFPILFYVGRSKQPIDFYNLQL
jgi:hypothetical protein